MNSLYSANGHLSSNVSQQSPDYVYDFPIRESLGRLVQFSRRIFGRLHFTPHQHRLKCGTRVSIKPITDTDSSAIAEIFGDLSPESYYMRFCTPAPMNCPERLAALAEKTTKDALAKGKGCIAYGMHPDGSQVPFGKARYVANQRGRAEIAVTIRDGYQGLGVGTLLIQELIQGARAEGVNNLFAHIHPQNYPMQALLSKLGFYMASEYCNELLMMELRLA